MSQQCVLMLSVLIVMLMCRVNSTHCKEYFVKPDNDEDSSKNVHTLQYYVKNSVKYFTSCTQIWFKPGQYYLTTNIVLSNTNNIAFTGMNPCNITFMAFAVSVCDSYNVKFENIRFMSSNGKPFKAHSKCKGKKWWYYNYSGLITLLHCKSITFMNVHLTISTQVNGIVVVNTRSISTISNITIVIENICKAHGRYFITTC